MRKEKLSNLTEDACEELNYWFRIAMVGDMVGVILAAIIAVFGFKHLGINEDTNIILWFAALVFTITGLVSLLLFMGKEAYHLWCAWNLTHRSIETMGELQGDLRRTCKVKTDNSVKSLKIYEFSWGDVNRGFRDELNELEEDNGMLVRYLEWGRRMFVVDILPKSTPS